MQALNLNKIELRIDLEESINNTFKLDTSVASTKRGLADQTLSLRKRTTNFDADSVEPLDISQYNQNV